MKFVVLRNRETKSLVGVDQSSGGYPWDTDNPNSIRFWACTDKGVVDAEEYAAHWKDKYELMKVEISPTWLSRVDVD